MRGTIRKLLAVAAAFALFALASFYTGTRYAAAHPPSPTNAISAQFASDPGDGWMLAGGFLMLIAVAVASACVMLWMREGRANG